MDFTAFFGKLGDFFMDICKIVVGGVVIAQVFGKFEGDTALFAGAFIATSTFLVGFVLIILSAIGGKK